LADTLIKVGQIEAGIQMHKEGMREAEWLVSFNPKRLEALNDLTISCDRLGSALSRTGDSAAAIEYFARALQMVEQRVALSSVAAQRRAIVIARSNLARELAESRPAEAIAHYRAALVAAEQEYARTPNDAQASRDFSIVYGRLGKILFDTGQREQGLEMYGKAQDIALKLLKADPADAQAHGDVAEGYRELGRMQRSQGRWRLASRLFSRALAEGEVAARLDPLDSEVQQFVSEVRKELGRSGEHPLIAASQ
jgi:tetratricopeptide (TPR) repeat protein